MEEKADKNWMNNHFASAEMVKMDLQERLNKSRRQAAEEEVALEKTGEEGVLLMKALLGLGDLVMNVNIPNQGQIGNLPVGAAVETNAWFGRNQVCPVYAGNLPDDILHLVTRHVVNQEGVVKACLKKDRNMLFNIFMNDPLVKIGPKEGKELFDTMVKNTEKYCDL